MRKIIPIILAGGSGSRLWPLSRKSFPKQFLNLIDEDQYSLLQNTYKRIESLENFSKPIIICNEEHRFIAGDQMRKLNIKPLEILLEPEGRNTAPAITIAALKALEIYNDPILLILSSDHAIQNKTKFTASIQESIKLAEENKLVIFGVRPTYPSTGYGYIKSIDQLDQNYYKASRVDKFIEKPDLKNAKEIYQDKKYSWNSGMFVFKARTILDELQTFAPDMINNCKICLHESKNDLDFLRLDKKHFIKCENISIDYAVLEKTKKAFVIPLNCGWNDIGSWESLWKISGKDINMNALKGKVILKETSNSLIRSEEKLVVSIGLKNIILIDTKDALLVADKKNSEEIKDIVSLLDEKGFNEGKVHKKVYRPWGSFLSIEENNNWQIKKIEVNPGAALSLQKHHHRSEHWIVVKGKAKVQINDKVKLLFNNESIYIPLGTKHRLSNPGDKPLIIIEVQSGDYLGEDDIVRFEDNYGRQ